MFSGFSNDMDPYGVVVISRQLAFRAHSFLFWANIYVVVFQS